MAKKELNLPYTSEEFLRKMEKPTWQVYDRAAGLYRYFADKEWYDKAFEALEVGDELTSEILSHELYNLTAPAPYTININSLTDNIYILEGDVNTRLGFQFSTVDGNGGDVYESVNCFYTFQSPSGSQRLTKVYSAGEEVSEVIDEYLALGTNVITITLQGRSTKASKTIVVTYHVVQLNLSTTFDIARALMPSSNFGVTYTVTGQEDKTVEFYVDGVLAATASVSSLESTATRTQILNNADGKWAPGKHSLQLRASMMAGNRQFYSRLLYFEFVITGIEQTVILLEQSFPNTTGILVGALPGLTGEQYVKQKLVWAYYSNDPLAQQATVTWRLFANGTETTLATRNADVVEAETDRKPDPLEFMPSETGNYNLQALIKGEIVESYTISVIANRNGLVEAVEGLTMKLTGLGRSNDEPEETLRSWADRGYKCTFSNMPFNGKAGYFDNAVVFDNGATGLIDVKPFAVEVGVQSNNGNCVEIDFETFNVNDEDAVLFQIGDLADGASLVITPSRAVLRSRLGIEIESKFKSYERVKLAFITHPNDISHTQHPRMMFVQQNGVLAPAKEYGPSDTFNIGSVADVSTLGMINVGNAEGKAGIKIYGIRTYNATINEWQELNNFIIDCSEDLTKMQKRNDIFLRGSTTQIDVDKLTTLLPVIKLTGDLESLIKTESKRTISAAAEVTFPEDPDLNFTCERLQLSNAGQSTLKMEITPSMHAKFDKDSNIMYDADGNPMNKNRWAFRGGNVPEKKMRLASNPMDSSCAHNGSFLRMINKVFPNVSIDGKYVLRTPAQDYVLSGRYASDMAAAHGGEAKDYKFPYTINIVPDSRPCVIVWRRDERSRYEMLGQYLMMEEKKANYANGMHSIYDKLDVKGNPDPFDFKEGAKGTRLWDNDGCLQFENLRNHAFTLFSDASDWDDRTEREMAYEKIYPDDDDETPEQIAADWDVFGNEVVKPISATHGDQEAFSAIYKDIFDIWHLAAYYILVLRQTCTDSLVRNLEWTRYEDGGKWIPKWWDVDMQLGLEQSGANDVPPMSDRNTVVNGEYAMSGRTMAGESSWLWDALEADPDFNAAVIRMEQALYEAKWTVENVIGTQDDEYVNQFSQALYNKDGEVKYLDAWLDGRNYLTMFQGDRTPHRHWFEHMNYDYFDALHVTGGYREKAISIRARGADSRCKMYFVAGAKSFFGFGQTETIMKSGVEANRGEAFVLDGLPAAGLLGNDPLQIYAANKLMEADFHEIARYIWGDIELQRASDDTTGSLLRKLILGISKEDMARGIINEQTHQWAGLSDLVNLEHFDIQGYSKDATIDLSAMRNLSIFHAAGSGLIVFQPANGTILEDVQLPLSVRSINMNGSTVGNLTWWNNASQSVMPSTLTDLSFSGMGSDAGAQALVHDWLTTIRASGADVNNYQIHWTNVNWTGVDINDILTLARLPKTQRQITGYIKCSTEYTSEQIKTLRDAFEEEGGDIFSLSNPLTFDCESDNIIVSAIGEGVNITEDGVVEILQGTTAQFSAVGFPIVGGNADYEWIMYVDDDPIQGSETFPNIPFGQNTMNWKTGVMNTVECADPDASYRVYVRKSNGADGIVDIVVKARTYPQTAEVVYRESQSPVEVVEGVVNVSSAGHYIFDANHLPEGYNGNFKDAHWEIEGVSEEYVRECTDNYLEGRSRLDEFCMQVLKLPNDEVEILLKYESEWLGGQRITAPDVRIALISVIMGLISSNALTGNPVLFAALEQAGLAHADRYSYNSAEIKRLIGEVEFNALLVAAGKSPVELKDFKSGSFENTLKYFKNVTGIDLHKTGVTGDVNMTGNKMLRSANVEGTQANVLPPSGSQFRDLALGAPTKVIIADGNSAVPTLQWASDVKEVSIENPQGGNAFAILDGILKQVEAEKNYEEVEIEQTPAEMGYDGMGAGTMQLPDLGVDVWTGEGNISVNPEGLVTIPDADYEEVKVKGVKNTPLPLEEYFALHPEHRALYEEWPDVANSFIDTGKRNWLQNDGSAYIDTGFNPRGIPFELDMHMDFEWLGSKSIATILGAFTWAGNEYTIGWVGGNRGIGIDNIKYYLQTADYVNNCHIQTQCGSFAIHDVNQQITESLTPSSISYNPGASLYLFASHQSGVGLHEGSNTRGKFEYVRFYREENEIQHLVPFVRNGEAGMIDLVSLQFYGNANSTGSFSIVTEENEGSVDVKPKVFFKTFAINMDKILDYLLKQYPELIPIVQEYPDLAPVLVEHPDYAPWIAEWPLTVNSLINTGVDNFILSDNAFIDTGYFASGGMDATFKLKVPTGKQFAFGSHNPKSVGGNEYNRNAYRVTNSNEYFDVLKSFNNTVSFLRKDTVETVHLSSIGGIKIYAVRDNIQQMSFSGTLTPVTSVVVFRDQYEGIIYSGTEFGDCIIKDSALEIVRHLVPFVRNGEAGMLDLLTGTFYGNANSTGSFTIITEDKND